MGRVKRPQFHQPLFGPLELVKDQSRIKSLVFAGALALGHPVYHLAWTRLSPQPYDSLQWRLVASALGFFALIAMVRLPATDRRSALAYGVASAFGTVILAAWFYVANGGDAVWLGSLAALTMLYYSLTDWRIASLVTALAYAIAYILVPRLGIGVWASGATSFPVFDVSAWLVLGFALGMSVLTRYTDMSMRVVRMRSQMRALAITAHEVRTPLASLQLLSQGLRDRLHTLPVRSEGRADLEDLEDLADDVVRFCEHAHSLIETHLANANPSKPFARRHPVRLGSVAAAALHTFLRGRLVREPVAILEVKRDFTISAEEGALQQVLVNLLNNAFKAVVLRHKTALPGQISILVDHIGVGLVRVTDTGAGISKQVAARMFDAFVTGDAEHGHGLGLTFVRSAVTSYGGKIDVESIEGQGTTFTITFQNAIQL